MNRVNLMWVIMIASAVTGVAQYVLMGVTGYNHNPQEFPWWFWVTEFVLWGVRALVESVCVGYIFMTVADNWLDRLSLLFFETIILLEIAFTVGIMTAAVSSGKNIYTMLQEIAGAYHFAWAFAMGAYAPLMMAGAGIAYRIQPVAAGSASSNEDLQRRCNELQTRCHELQLDNQRGEVWQRMSAAAKAKIAVEDIKNQNGNGNEFERIAREELGAQAVSRAKRDNAKT